MRVLIIDDSIVMRKIVESALRNCTAGVSEVLHAANGKDGLAALEASATHGLSIDLIFCDVHMPVMDGLKFLAERTAYPSLLRTPVLMITADPGDPYLRHSIAAGAAGYIAKPFTLDQVQKAIDSVMSGSSRRIAPHHAAPSPIAPKAAGGVR
ncbi:MAG TPA: response regulator [Acidobacteriaceae bacterium]|nr:response regulator [Acidobacteriaceae bacterium]